MNITQFLPKGVFWDVDPNTLEWARDRKYIVTKVFMFVNSTNYKPLLEILEKVYTKQQIYDAIQYSNEYLRLNMQACNKVAEEYQKEPLYTAAKVEQARKNKDATYFKRTLSRRDIFKLKSDRLQRLKNHYKGNLLSQEELREEDVLIMYAGQQLLTKDWNSEKDKMWDNIDDFDEV